jgi:hypothetical protein
MAFESKRAVPQEKEFGMQQIGRCYSLAASLLGVALVAGMATARAQGSAEGGAIFTCTAASGKRLTSDRPIAECLDREQRVLNKDGSLRMVMPPSLTSDERAALEDSERRKIQERANRQDAIRRDRNLLVRFPNEEAHDRARDAALSPVLSAVQSSEQRLIELEKERKPLMTETEFYQGKPLPGKLKSQIDNVDVSIEAQRSLVVTQQVEVKRINANFDAELVRLKKLWAGAEPGSLGPLPQSAPGAAGAPRPAAQTAAKP